MEEEEKQIVSKWQYNKICDTLDHLFLEAMDSAALSAGSILDILDVEYRR